MGFTVTAFYAGLCALILLWLTYAVIKQRRARQISVLDGNDPVMARVMRGHGNATETIPIFLILMLCAESMGAPALLLHFIGLAFVAGRACHGYWFVSGLKSFQARVAGMMLTIFPTLALAGGLVLHALYDMLVG